MCGGIFSHTFRGPKHLICIPADPGPPEGADLIDDLRRVSSTGSQIAAMENEVGCDLPQVGENCLEGAPIAVNIRYDCDSHFVRCRLCDNRLAAGRYNFSLLNWGVAVLRPYNGPGSHEFVMGQNVAAVDLQGLFFFAAH